MATRAHVRAVVVDPEVGRRFAHIAHDLAGQVIDEVEKDVQRLVPVDTGLLKTTVKKGVDGGTGWVSVGEAGHEVDTSYWEDVEYGTRPHGIDSHGRWPLRNDETGEIFGRHVNHPGTEAQPYLRPSTFQERALRPVEGV